MNNKHGVFMNFLAKLLGYIYIYIPRRTADDAPAADATSISTSFVSVA